MGDCAGRRGGRRGPLQSAIHVGGEEGWFWDAQRGISGRLASGSDHLGARYRCKDLLAVGQVRTVRPVADQPMPSKLLEHRAVLTLPDGTPFSEVVETYTDKVLAFPIPQS